MGETEWSTDLAAAPLHEWAWVTTTTGEVLLALAGGICWHDAHARPVVPMAWAPPSPPDPYVPEEHTDALTVH